MARTNLGRVALVFRGEYEEAKEYRALDVATYEGSAYVCLQDGTAAQPTDASGWQLLAEKGGAGADGVSPVVDVEEISGGYRLTITDANGARAAELMHGADGVSPVVAVEKEGKVTTVTFTDAWGVKTATLLDGEDGLGTGDMRAEVYDADGDGVVDRAAALSLEAEVPQAQVAGLAEALAGKAEVGHGHDGYENRLDALEGTLDGVETLLAAI